VPASATSTLSCLVLSCYDDCAGFSSDCIAITLKPYTIMSSDKLR